MNNNVNERVKQLRTALKLNQADFCMKIGMSVPGLYRIENSDVKPRTSTLRQMSNIFNVNEDWLISGTGDMFQDTSTEVQSNSSKSFSNRTIEAMERHIDTLERNNRSLIDTLNKVMEKFNVNFLNGIAEMAGITESNSCNTVRVAQKAA